jgi:hypothetical protein
LSWPALAAPATPEDNSVARPHNAIIVTRILKIDHSLAIGSFQ